MLHVYKSSLLDWLFVDDPIFDNKIHQSHTYNYRPLFLICQLSMH